LLLLPLILLQLAQLMLLLLSLLASVYKTCFSFSFQILPPPPSSSSTCGCSSVIPCLSTGCSAPSFNIINDYWPTVLALLFFITTSSHFYLHFSFWVRFLQSGPLQSTNYPSRLHACLPKKIISFSVQIIHKCSIPLQTEGQWQAKVWGWVPHCDLVPSCSCCESLRVR